jgi:acyl-CoA thioesterase YciA
MKFHEPILLGDVLSVYTEIERVGRTSITVDIEIWVERRGVAEEVFVTEGRFVYVAIDQNGRPQPVDIET